MGAKINATSGHYPTAASRGRCDLVHLGVLTGDKAHRGQGFGGRKRRTHKLSWAAGQAARALVRPTRGSS